MLTIATPSEMRIYIYDLHHLLPHVASVLGPARMPHFTANYTACVSEPFRCTGLDPEFADGLLVRDLPLALKQHANASIVDDPMDADGVLVLIWEYAFCIATGMEPEEWEAGKKVVFASCGPLLKLWSRLQTTPRWRLRGGSDFAFLVPPAGAQYWQSIRGRPPQYVTAHHKVGVITGWWRHLHELRFLQPDGMGSLEHASDVIERITRRSIHVTTEDTRHWDDMGTSRVVIVPYYSSPAMYYDPDEHFGRSVRDRPFLASFAGTVAVKNTCERCTNRWDPRDIRQKMVDELSPARAKIVDGVLWHGGLPWSARSRSAAATKASTAPPAFPYVVIKLDDITAEGWEDLHKGTELARNEEFDRRIHRDDVDSLRKSGIPFGEVMRNSTFCLIPRGDTASTKRFYASVLSGCVPVVISDQFRPAMAPLVDAETAMVRIPESLFMDGSFALGTFLHSLARTERLSTLQAAGRAIKHAVTFLGNRAAGAAKGDRQDQSDATGHVARMLVNAFGDVVADMEAVGLCAGLMDDDTETCVFSPSTPQAIIQAACSESGGLSKLATSCMLTCCQRLQCTWVAQRPSTRCNLLLNDGRTAGELCLAPVERASGPNVCSPHAAPSTRLPLDLPVFWITLNDTATRSQTLRSQLERVAVQHTRVAAVNKAQAKDAITSGVTYVMSTGLNDAPAIQPPAPPTSYMARRDFDSRVSLSVVACALSHLKAVHAAYVAGHDRAVILEDDVSLRSAFNWPYDLSQMTSAAQTPAGGFDILQLASHGWEYLNSSTRLKQPFWPARSLEAWRRWDLVKDTSSAAYLITRPAMASLLQYTQTSATGTKWLATPVHADKLLFGYLNLHQRVYTRNTPLVLCARHTRKPAACQFFSPYLKLRLLPRSFQIVKSQIAHLKGINDHIDKGAMLVNGFTSRQLDTATWNATDAAPDANATTYNEVIAGRSPKHLDYWGFVHSLTTQGDSDDDEDYVCHHHFDIPRPCVSSHTCPVRGWVGTLEACKRRCCATEGCGLFTHNAFAQCYLKTLPPIAHTKMELRGDSVRHRTVTCRRTDRDALCTMPDHKVLEAQLLAGRDKDDAKQTGERIGSAACDLTEHQWLLVLSAGRSGSTTVLQMLRQLPGVQISGEHAGVMTSFRDLAERLAVTEQHKVHEIAHGDPDYAWSGQAPLSRRQLLCLVQDFSLRATGGRASGARIRGWKEIRYANRADLDFIAEAFPSAKFVINYRETPQQSEDQTVRSAQLAGTTATWQEEAARNLSSWAKDHPSRVFKLVLEELTAQRFTQLASWIGLPECRATRVLHFNKGGWQSWAKGKAWMCLKNRTMMATKSRNSTPPRRHIDDRQQRHHKPPELPTASTEALPTPSRADAKELINLKYSNMPRSERRRAKRARHLANLGSKTARVALRSQHYD